MSASTCVKKVRVELWTGNDFLQDDSPDEARCVTVWRDKGKLMAKIACQTHGLDEWRKKGRDYIWEELVDLDEGTTQEDLDELIKAPDDEEGFKAVFNDLLAQKRVANAKALKEVDFYYARLLEALEYAERVLESTKPPPKKAKESPKKGKAAPKAKK